MQVRIDDSNGDIRSGVCYIVGAGKIINTSWLKHQIKPGPDDYVIAADGGFATCDTCGIHMNLVLGDFDSLGFVPVHPNLIRLASEKDDTDMFYAIKQGLSLGYRTFEIYGGTGGRPDHTMANYQCLSYLASQGACGILCSPGYRITAIHNDTLKLPAYEKGIISVFTLSDKAEGVGESGVKYKLSGANLTSSNPLGISNEFIGEQPVISVEKGTLLVMWELSGKE